MKILMKWILLSALAFQNALLVLLISYYNKNYNSNTRLHPSIMVCWVEIAKLIICTALELRTNGSINLSLLESWWLCIPALLYAMQNNLCHVALRHLNPLVYQVLYQSKILTTAMFSVILLGRKLQSRQWLALLLLTGGVVLVQLDMNDKNKYKVNGEGNKSMWKGLGALGFAATSSGFAGVLFEYVLKGKKGGKNASFEKNQSSLWRQSIILCLFALPISIILAMTQISSKETIALFPQDQLALILISLQALSGVLVAIIIRHLDNILKTFATGASIVLCALFDWKSDQSLMSRFSWQFWLGTSLVLFSVYYYSSLDNIIPKKNIKRVESGRIEDDKKKDK